MVMESRCMLLGDALRGTKVAGRMGRRVFRATVGNAAVVVEDLARRATFSAPNQLVFFAGRSGMKIVAVEAGVEDLERASPEAWQESAESIYVARAFDHEQFVPVHAAAFLRYAMARLTRQGHAVIRPTSSCAGSRPSGSGRSSASRWRMR